MTGTKATNLQKSILSSSPSEDGFFSSETRHKGRAEQRTKAKTSENVSWVQVPMTLISVTWRLSTMEERYED